MITRDRILQDPKSGCRPLFAQSARYVIAAANRAASLSEPEVSPLPRRASIAVTANRRVNLCWQARKAAHAGDFTTARAKLAEAVRLGETRSCGIGYAERYITAAEAEEPWTADPKWAACHLPRNWNGPRMPLTA